MNLLRISVGQGGNQLNYSLSNLIYEKNNETITNYDKCPFDTNTCKSFLIDSESKVVNKFLKNDKLKKIYNTSNTLVNSNGRGNNWALGYSLSYKEKNRENIVIESLEKITKMIEKSDFINGFSFLHSLNGGTGSGLCSRLIELLKDEYPKYYFIDFPILGYDIENTPLSCFNQFFTIGHTYKYLDYTFMIKNEKINEKYIEKDSFNFEDINKKFSSFYYDVFYEFNVKHKKNILFDNVFNINNTKFLDFMNIKIKLLEKNDNLDYIIKSFFLYYPRDNLTNKNLFSSLSYAMKSSSKLNLEMKDMESLIKKSFSPFYTKSYDIYDNSMKQNEMDLNIITSNLGVVHYIEDLLKDVIDKVKSR